MCICVWLSYLMLQLLEFLDLSFRPLKEHLFIYIQIINTHTHTYIYAMPSTIQSERNSS